MRLFRGHNLSSAFTLGEVCAALLVLYQSRDLSLMPGLLGARENSCNLCPFK
jgi:hypothetical protein